MKKTLTLLALLTTLLSACATQSTYAPADKASAPGYSETRLSEGRYRVSFTGNTITPAGTVRDYALLRSAELTLQEGRDWFTVVSRDNDKKVSSYTSGSGVDYAPQTQVYQSCGLLGCRTAVATTPGFSSPDIASTTTSTAYSSSLEIVMGKNPKPASGDNYDARELARNLRANMSAKK